MSNVNPRQLVEFLNELAALDADAISRLCLTRVECNQALADHPTVQVMDVDGGSKVGLLGILNGLIGADNNVFLFAHWDEHGKLTGFSLQTGKVA